MQGDVKILHGDFLIVKKLAKKGDFVYFDPPYYPLNTTSFTTYTMKSFLDKEQKALRDLFVALDKKGCFVMLSNSSTKFIRTIYREKGYKIGTVSATRVISCDASKRGAITEVLVRNYPHGIKKG